MTDTSSTPATGLCAPDEPTPRRPATGPVTASRETADPVDRDSLLTAARAGLDRGRGVLLRGPAGIGKSTVLGTLAAEHTLRGHRLLRCSPSESEQRLPFIGLIDLISGVQDAMLGGLTSYEQDMLRTLLCSAPPKKADPPAAGPDSVREALSLRIVLLKAFGVLCADAPVLLVIDDAQWLDRHSTEALAFVARRAAGLALGVIAAVRTDGMAQAGHPPEPAEGRRRPGSADPPGPAVSALCPSPLLTLDVPPMTEREVSELLVGRGSRYSTRPMADRLRTAAGGNPFFVLELARSLDEETRAAGGLAPGPARALPVPDSLRDMLIGRLRTLPAGARETVLAAAAAVLPTVRLLSRAAADRSPAGLDTAALGKVADLLPNGVVRFSNPLMPVVVYEDAAPEHRLRVHARLAEVADDPVERAYHLGSTTPGRDEEVAAELTAAAATARRRGAAAVAARLGELAADRTLADDLAAYADRRLSAAEDAVTAGDYALARRLAYEVLDGSRMPAVRVRAWMVVIDSCGQAMSEVADVFPQALADARNDSGLLALLHYRLSWRAWIVEGSAVKAHGHASRSAHLAARAGDRRTELLALSSRAALEFYLGSPEAERTLARALVAPREPCVTFDHNGPVYLRHRSHLLHDRLDDARTELRTLIYTVRQRGPAESLCQCLSSLALVEIHRGRCAQALDLAHQSLRAAEKAGLSQGPEWYAVALAEAAGGCPDRALSAAEHARRHSEDDDDLLFLPRTVHAEGLVRLLRGEDAEAVAALRLTRDLETRQGQGDPAMRRWQADLAEALVRTGCEDEAVELIAGTRAQATRLGRHGVLAALERVSALVAEGRGDLAAAADGLDRAAAQLAAIGYPIEEGRARLALGRVHSRRGDPRAARTALSDAMHIFSRSGARPWLALAVAGLDQLEFRPAPVRQEGPWFGPLTETERRTVSLAAEGASNREIAAGLVVSVKTVEAALTRAYRKLGVRSRVDLARVVMARQPER